MSEFGGLQKHEKTQHALCSQEGKCTVNGNGRTMICTLSNARWQQASKPAALWRLVDLERLR